MRVVLSAESTKEAAVTIAQTGLARLAEQHESSPRLRLDLLWCWYCLSSIRPSAPDGQQCAHMETTGYISKTIWQQDKL